jgi:hypothetical protein
MAGNIPCTTDNLIVGTYNLCLNGIDLGATTGGVTISQSNTFTDVRNDQSTTLQARFRTQQDWTVTTIFRELSLDKLRVFYGITEGLNPAGDILCISEESGGCTFPEEFELTVCGPGPGCGCRTFHFPRVVFTPDQLDYTIVRDTPVEMSVTFTILSSCPDGTIGCITDRCDEIATDETTTAPLVCALGQIPDYVAP